jgi:hypothetical protein
LLQRLAGHLDIDAAIPAGATFRVWDIRLNNVTDKSRSSYNARWYVRTPRNHDTNLKPIPIQYCPQCLGDPQPYYRKAWRLAFVTVCPTHKCQLASTCSECGSGGFLRATLRSPKQFRPDGGLQSCLQCGANLGRNSAVPTGCSSRVFALQGRLLEALEVGTVQISGTVMSSAKLFAFLAYMVTYFWTLTRADRHRDLLESVSGVRVTLPPASSSRLYFEGADSHHREATMEAMAWLLENWPENHLAFQRAFKTTRASTLFRWYMELCP